MTYLEMCKRVRQECAVGSTGPVTVLNQSGMLKKLVDWSRDAWRDIQNKRPDWRFLWEEFEQPASAGLAVYDLGRLDGDPLFNGQRLASARLAAGSGAPTHYWLRPDDRIELGPTPDADGILSGARYRAAQVLSADDEVILLKDRYLDTILWRAVRSYAAHEEATALFNYAEMMYRNNLAVLAAEQLPAMRQGEPLA